MMTTSRQILIVDDAPDIQALLVMLFEGEGYKVDIASNGLDAITFLRSTSHLPNLVLLDLMMPEMDGFQFRQEQGKDPRLAGIPVVIMTADNNIQALAVRCNASGYLKKPFVDPETVLDTVEKYFVGEQTISG